MIHCRASLTLVSLACSSAMYTSVQSFSDRSIPWFRLFLRLRLLLTSTSSNIRSSLRGILSLLSGALINGGLEGSGISSSATTTAGSMTLSTSGVAFLCWRPWADGSIHEGWQPPSQQALGALLFL